MHDRVDRSRAGNGGLSVHWVVHDRVDTGGARGQGVRSAVIRPSRIAVIRAWAWLPAPSFS